jgi:hypothetical protein
MEPEDALECLQESNTVLCSEWEQSTPRPPLVFLATDGNIIWHMRFACYLTKATDIHSECAIFFVCPRQRWFRGRASALRLYVQSLSLLILIFSSLYVQIIAVYFCVEQKIAGKILFSLFWDLYGMLTFSYWIITHITGIHSFPDVIRKLCFISSSHVHNFVTLCI